MLRLQKKSKQHDWNHIYISSCWVWSLLLKWWSVCNSSRVSSKIPKQQNGHSCFGCFAFQASEIAIYITQCLNRFLIFFQPGGGPIVVLLPLSWKEFALLHCLESGKRTVALSLISLLNTSSLLCFRVIPCHHRVISRRTNVAQGKLAKDLASGCICKPYKLHHLGMAQCPLGKRVNNNKKGEVPMPNKKKGSNCPGELLLCLQLDLSLFYQSRNCQFLWSESETQEINF